MNNCDHFNSAGIKLEQEEVMIKDDPEQVQDSSVVFKCNTNYSTLCRGEIKVDSSNVDNDCEHAVTSKLHKHLNSKLEIPVQESFTSDFEQNTKTADLQKNKTGSNRKLYTYSEESLKQALVLIRSGQVSIRQASKHFGVPRPTLQDRLHGRRGDDLKKPGPEPIMTIEGEKQIADWAIQMGKCGFPIRKENLIDTVIKIARATGKIDRFINKKPGTRWYANFLKRHPEICVREAEKISKSGAIVTEESIRLWFRALNEFLDKKNCKDLVENPSRVFNAGESGFGFCPKTGKVLTPREWKSLYQKKTGDNKESISILITFNASGNVCPPLVIFSYVRPPKALVNTMPSNWVLGKFDSGRMRGDVFFEYICNDFNKWLEKNEIERPVILFVDGRKSHLTLPLSQFCEENGIILYALPPNTTHFLQPVDVTVFRPMKQQWQNTMRAWQSKPENVDAIANKFNFCSVFQETLEMANMAESIKDGFRKCGLFPLNPDNVDYANCVQNTLEEQHSTEDKTGTTLTTKDCRTAVKVIKAIEDRLCGHGINVQVIIDEIKQLENNINAPLNLQGTVDAGSTISMNNVVFFNETNDVPIDPLSQLETCNIVQKTSEHDISNDCASNIQLEESSCEPQTYNISQKTVEQDMRHDHPSDIQFEECTFEQQTYNVEHKIHLSSQDEVAGISQISPTLLNHQVDTSKRKEKFPSAISCEKWRKYYEKTKETEKKPENIQKRKELGELNQVQRRKKQKTVGTNKKKNTVKENNKCFFCEDDLYSETEEDSEKHIGCDCCPKWYHLRCTEFAQYSYAAVTQKQFICDMCK